MPTEWESLSFLKCSLDYLRNEKKSLLTMPYGYDNDKETSNLKLAFFSHDYRQATNDGTFEKDYTFNNLPVRLKYKSKSFEYNYK